MESATINFPPQEGDAMLQMLLNTSILQRNKMEWSMVSLAKRITQIDLQFSSGFIENI